MVLARRYCVEYVDGTIECFRDGFWYSDKGIIIKWAILGSIFFFFMAWFLGGYIHAKSRMKKGKPLLAYHRWLVPYSVRRQYGQVPQNHFTFYAAQPYGQQQGQQRQDGTWAEPPPMYGGDAPPGYYPPPGATKMNPNQQYAVNAMEMPQYGIPPQAAAPMGQQQTGVVGQQGSAPQGGNGSDGLPPRPPAQAKVALQNFVSRFRR